MLGRTIGKYRVVEKIGRGGMGTVFKAVDETLAREVAIKVLNPDLAETDVVKRFRAEAMTLARLSHPGIATIYELFRTDDELLMVMEFVRGETFDRVVERSGPLPAARAASLCAQVLDALGHAHRVGIVHRDLKPANLMVTEYGAIKIMDFGIARVLGTEHLTSDGYMMGTPAYMAPEQVLATDVDARADLYSIGVVLYRLLTGSLPFQADTAIAMAHKQLKDPPTPLWQFRAELPAWCDDVLARALAKSAADRYQTAEEFRDALVGAGASLVPATPPATPAPTPSPLPRPAAEAAYAPTVSVATPAPEGEARAAGPAPSAHARVEGASAPQRTPQQVSPTADGTTVILRKQHLAVAAGLLALLVVAIGALAIAVMQRPAAAPVAGTTRAPASNVQGRVEAPRPSGEPAPPPAKAPQAASSNPEAVKAAGGSSGARDAAPARSRGARDMGLPPLTIADVKVLVADGARQRERDATLTFAAGMLTIADKNGAVVRAMPYDQILSVSYSRSRQPMWQSPGGPAPAIRVGGGAFGFLRSDPHWLSVRTPQSFVVLRVAAGQTKIVPAAFANRAGITVQVVRQARPK